jgi:hypothetical protein
MNSTPSQPRLPQAALTPAISCRQRAKAFGIMLAFGLLIYPVIVLFGLLTLPIGIGVVLFLAGLDWVMYLYPFVTNPMSTWLNLRRFGIFDWSRIGFHASYCTFLHKRHESSVD